MAKKLDPETMEFLTALGFDAESLYDRLVGIVADSPLNDKPLTSEQIARTEPSPEEKRSRRAYHMRN
jgi:hypothetical protein